MKTRRSLILAMLVICGCVMCLLCGGVLSSTRVTGAPPPQGEIARFRNVPTWYLYFDVTVKGKEPNGAERWEINDTYSGSVALDTHLPLTKPLAQSAQMTPMQKAQAVKKQMASGIQWTHLPGGVQRMGPFNGVLPLEIDIMHLINVLDKDPCGDDVKTATLRKGKDPDFSYQAPYLQADLDKLTYNVTIPFLPDSAEKKLKITQAIDETTNGQKQHHYTERDVPFKQAWVQEFPSVKGLVEKGKIHHDIDRPLNAQDPKWGFDSGEREPDKPVFPNAIDENAKVTIRVRYLFSRTPITKNDVDSYFK